jgi:glycine/D-amino acid oxidase-like deaminating enzyme
MAHVFHAFFGSIKTQWTGIMGFSADRNPFVGQTGRKNVYVVAGFTGHGMPLGSLCARKVVDLILTGENSIPAHFNPLRRVAPSSKL